MSDNEQARQTSDVLQGGGIRKRRYCGLGLTGLGFAVQLLSNVLPRLPGLPEDTDLVMLLGGSGLFVLGLILVVGAMAPLQSDNIRKQDYGGLVLVALGLLAHLLLIIVISTGHIDKTVFGLLVSFFLFSGIGLSVIGLAYFARDQGRQRAWCALGIVPIMGPALAYVFMSMLKNTLEDMKD